MNALCHAKLYCPELLEFCGRPVPISSAPTHGREGKADMCRACLFVSTGHAFAVVVARHGSLPAQYARANGTLLHYSRRRGLLLLALATRLCVSTAGSCPTMAWRVVLLVLARLFVRSPPTSMCPTVAIPSGLCLWRTPVTRPPVAALEARSRRAPGLVSVFARGRCCRCQVLHAPPEKTSGERLQPRRRPTAGDTGAVLHNMRAKHRFTDRIPVSCAMTIGIGAPLLYPSFHTGASRNRMHVQSLIGQLCRSNPVLCIFDCAAQGAYYFHALVALPET